MSTKTNLELEDLGKTFLLYILNDLGKSSEFHEDLFELFGSEDGSKRGLVGSWDKNTGDFKTACWDWGALNFRHVINLLFIIGKRSQDEEYDQKEFEDFYESEIKYGDDILGILRGEDLVTGRLFGLYVMRYGKQFPALVLDLKRIDWKRSRTRPLLIEFRPTKYFILDPKTWDQIKGECEGEKFWCDFLQVSTGSRIEEFLQKFSNMKQRGYGLLPLHSFTDELSEAQTLFIKDVEKASGNEIVLDNQIFWELFREFTGRSQVMGEVILTDDYRRRIYNIPINSLTEKTLVYYQEAGVANTLCHLLLEIFGNTYLEKEFASGNEITPQETNILKRNFLAGNIEGEEDSEFSECDYDYLLDLEDLGIEKKILFNLTTALWEKGHGKSYREFTNQWKYLHFTIPANRLNCSIVWYITIPETEEDFFEKSPSHEDFTELVGDLNREERISVDVVRDEGDLPVGDRSQVVCIPVFEHSRRTKRVTKKKGELRSLLKDHKRTLFYKATRSHLKRKIKGS